VSELRVTVDQVMVWSPCKEYTRARVEELFAGRETVTAIDVLEMDIPAVDRLWAVCREELIPAATLHEFGCIVTEQALIREREAGREPHPDSWAAIEAKRKWLRGEITNKELKAAADAAWAAADAAWVAPWAAAGAAAEAAAWAVLLAPWAAAGAAWAAEQCEKLKELLEAESKK